MTASASRVVLITGAAGGLGQALVAEFAAQGWRVVAAAHRRPAASSGTPSVPGASSPSPPASQREKKTTDGSWGENSVWPVQLDVTSAHRIAEVIAQTLQRWQRLDALVNNAGCVSDQALWQMKTEDWDSVLAVNLKGAFLCAQAAARVMARQREGQIISVGSYSGRVGARGQTNYAAAKAGLIGLTTSLARELGSGNVRANVVLPGVLRTAMTARLSAAQWQTLTDANALGRLNSTEEVARFVVFLAGLQNVSGQVFQLDSRIARWT